MVKYVDFDIYKKYPKLLAAFSTKEGGVSTGIYESMNLSLSSKDNILNVQENYRRFANALGVPVKSFVISEQQHTTNIKVVGKEDEGKGLFHKRDYNAIDGFITNEIGPVLCLLYADCIPVYLYDPVNHAIALLHSGWKGTAGKISEKAIKMMHEKYGTLACDIVSVIGPGICTDCYEVSDDLLAPFEKNFSKEQINVIFKEGRISDEGEKKYQLDLKKAIEFTLLDAGMSPSNISDPEICTCCRHDLFFSHRYTKGKRGNLAAVMSLLK